MMVVEFLCFSRGVLLFLACAGAATVAAVSGLSRSPQAKAVLFLPAALVLLTLFFPGGSTYWIQQIRFGEGSSAASRVSQWSKLGSVEPAPSREVPLPARVRNAVPGEQTQSLFRRLGGPTRRLLLGYGLGHYGVLRGLGPDSGTHNIFLDALVEAGIGGLMFFCAFFAIGLRRCWRSWRESRMLARAVQAVEWSRLLALMSVVVIGVLVDYRLENLGTMTGSAVLWFVLTPPRPATVEGARLGAHNEE
jgi:O-antigen ligase